jgi:hypothetical protein
VGDLDYIDYYDPYFYYAESESGGGYDGSWANPPDNSTGGDYYNGDWQPTGDGGWYDEYNGIYVDQYGGWYDMTGGGDGSGGQWGQYDNGEWYYTIDSPDYTTPGINDSDLQDTLSWWGSLDAVVNENNVDTLFNNSDLQDTLSWWESVTGGHSLGGDLAVINEKPPATATKSDKLAWLKKLANAAKKQVASGQKPSSGGASAGGASGAKTAQPNAAGQCPAGYVKNATGQCVQQPKPTANAAGLFGNIDPIYLIGGAVLLVLLAKK